MKEKNRTHITVIMENTPIMEAKRMGFIVGFGVWDKGKEPGLL